MTLGLYRHDLPPGLGGVASFFVAHHVMAKRGPVCGRQATLMRPAPDEHGAFILVCHACMRWLELATKPDMESTP